MGKRSALVILLYLATCWNAGAGDNRPGDSTIDPGSSTTTAPDQSGISLQPTSPDRPWFHPELTSSVADKLRRALEIANDRIDRIPACAGLFTDLGFDAAATLDSVFYLPAQSQHEESVCDRVVALTIIGGSKTWVCRSYSDISDKHAAMVVIHEALHHAGLRERAPRRNTRIADRKSMTSTEINQMVTRACRL